ncbi:SRPBCC domain-containing protein [Nonomuraea soli]|uniref:Uncharacterized protein YndB with AHSA1/START domain/catechol 2,3-dioxygenase-like lactoylglutathione lyase family enzyme n=1 Tax=Nonomuraea soli TaxID=1032476 RepID=A0A7W0HQI2_9ACTN|nr:SRPBCC domain-containing protein [Nonomuraea soli]MBA2891968.1 uncharacterized protein YndB with AHSA1/START domain/catechol 2,3-dioxygenase-like lactoylglutathione lyase family enzyme [Nonomuraea soli]
MTTPTDRSIVITRAFDAPRALVYDAWTKPDLLMRWYGADGWRLVECEIDLRPGGRWRYYSIGPGGEGMGSSGVYREVVPGERLVTTEVFDEQSYPGEALNTIEFTGDTLVTITLTYDSRAIRDIQLRYPMERGITQAFRRLDRVLMNWTLEVVVVPVSDVDRAKEFYADKLGFKVDHDTDTGTGTRFVQLTPPGSGCSIVIGQGTGNTMAPGSLQGLQLVVNDIHAARAELVERGMELGEIQVFGAEGPRAAKEGDDLNNVGFLFFSDPDGNGWAIQQITSRP